jgi:hypothetical protein
MCFAHSRKRVAQLSYLQRRVWKLGVLARVLLQYRLARRSLTASELLRHLFS